ncbi:MAG: HAD family hydrolase [Bdellovibrionaceae bacterium]|nr:HAD family hydrolase [Pseudobdellovibrionaceae bacterium]
MARPRYVIFDCDGVLVDSEILANRVEAEVKTELGFPTTLEEQIQKFVGLGTNHPLIQEELARLPSNYLALVDERVEAVYARELKPISGVAEVLMNLERPRCVASSSELAWIERKLAWTGLAAYFPSVLFSGHMVTRGKPAPDLFLHAAGEMGWDVSECLVVEDSAAGVRAGKAAGMKVCGFTGGKHILPGHADALLALGADFVIHDFRRLLDLV